MKHKLSPIKMAKIVKTSELEEMTAPPTMTITSPSPKSKMLKTLRLICPFSLFTAGL